MYSKTQVPIAEDAKAVTLVKVVKPDIWTRKATEHEVTQASAEVVDGMTPRLKVEEVTEEEFQKRQRQDFVDWCHSRGFEPSDPRNYLPTPTEAQVLQEADMKLHPEKYEVKNG